MQDDVHDKVVLLLLQSDALWAEKCRCDLLEADGQSSRVHNRAQSTSLCG